MGLLSFIFGNVESKADNTEKKDNREFEILKFDGVKALKTGMVDYAIKCLTSALEIKQDYDTMEYLATIYLRTYNTDEAKELLGKMVEMQPDNFVAYTLMANVYSQEEDLAQTREYGLKALELNPNQPNLYVLLSRNELRGGNSELAQEYVSKSLEQDNTSFVAKQLMAEVLTVNGQYDKAEELINQLIADEVEPDECIILLGDLFLAKKDADEARAQYERALEYNPFNEKAKCKLALLYSSMGETQKGIDYLTEEVESNGESVALFSALSQLYGALGDEAKKNEFAVKADELQDEIEPLKQGRVKVKEQTIPGIF